MHRPDVDAGSRDLQQDAGSLPADARYRCASATGDWRFLAPVSDLGGATRPAGRPLRPDQDAAERLESAARPVLDQFADDLADSRMSVLLTDERGHVVDRRVSEPSLRAQLDRINNAPGSVDRGDHAGTNAIRTALARHLASVVDGGEHLVEPLTGMAFASAPVTDPHSSQIIGVVGLICWAGDAHSLMLPVARRAAMDIERRLAESSPATGALLERFLAARRGARGAVVALDQTTMLANAAAVGLVGQVDRDALWAWAADAIGRHGSATAALCLASGTWVRVRCDAVQDGRANVGCVLRIDRLVGEQRPGEGRAPGRRRRARVGWASLTPNQRAVAAAVAGGMTNRETATRLFLSPHTVDYHLRQIFRKLGIRSRVELARLVIEHSGSELRPDGESARRGGLCASVI